jgi:hypothetical protein
MCGNERIGNDHNSNGSVHIGLLDLPSPICGILETMRTLLGVQIGILNGGAEATTDVAEAWFGLGTGLTVASEVFYLFKALRQARRSTFRFSNPACPVCREFVTEHEQMLIDIIVSLQTQNLVCARTTAIMLCEGHDENPLLDAAADIAETLAHIRVLAKPTLMKLH